MPTAKRFERLPKMPDRTVNVRDRLGMGFAGAQGNRTEDVGAKHAVGRAVRQVLDLVVDALADHGIDTAAPLLAGPAALQAAMVRGRTDGGFAPPWRPILYLRSHVPKRRVDLDVSNRRTSGKTMEIDMTKTNIVIITAVTRMLEHLATIDRTYDHNACAIVTNPDADILLPGNGIMLGGNTGRISAKDKARKACGTVIGDHAMIDLADDTDCTDDDGSFRVSRRHGRIGPDDAAAYIV